MADYGTTRIPRPAVADIVKPPMWDWDADLLAEPFRSIAKTDTYLIWPLWEGEASGDTQDVSGNGRHGVVGAGVTLSSLPVGTTLYDSDGDPGARGPYDTTGGIGVTIIAGVQDIRTGLYGGCFFFGGASANGSIRFGHEPAFTADYLGYRTILDSPYSAANFEVADSVYGRNDYHVYAIKVGWGRKQMWIDGVNYLDEARAGTLYGYADQGFSLGRGNYDNVGYGHCAFAYVFTGELSEAEIQLISADPFGLIRQARPIPTARQPLAGERRWVRR